MRFSAVVPTYLLTFIRQKRTGGYSLSPKEVLLLSFPDSCAKLGEKALKSAAGALQKMTQKPAKA